jgi:formamidopyrimidine-DNA glycosylase
MPELPEIVHRAREIDAALTGRTVTAVTIFQPKCLNIPADAFIQCVVGQTFHGAQYRGKWILAALDDATLLLNLGMGGEILLHAPGEPLPEKVQAVFDLDDASRLSFHFWWFGYIHVMASDRLAEHTMTAELGIDPLAPAFTAEALATLLAGRRARIKSLLLNQKVIAGIGNMYSHDVLFRAKLHPDRLAHSLSPAEIRALWSGIRDTLQTAIDLGGSDHEQGLHGNVGAFGLDHLLVGYREGHPCPSCGATITRIRTGSTQGFICPECQVLE